MEKSIELIKKMSPMRLIFEGLKALGIVFLVAYLFYKSYIAVIFVLPAGVICFYKSLVTYDKHLRQNIRMQFKDGILSVSASLSAGYSIENAFREAIDDLVLLYGEKSVMVGEFRMIASKLSLNRNIEDALSEMGERIDDDEARVFAEIIRFAKRSGGDMVSIIRRTADTIDERQKVKTEISVMVAAKKYEQSIMNIIPFGIIAYLNFAMPGMLDILYHNVMGVIIMTVALILYGLAIFLSKKITDIEV